jgi:hypothetical protein
LSEGQTFKPEEGGGWQLPDMTVLGIDTDAHSACEMQLLKNISCHSIARPSNPSDASSHLNVCRRRIPKSLNQTCAFRSPVLLSATSVGAKVRYFTNDNGTAFKAARLVAAQVAARATCKLHIEGFGSAQGIKSAELSCSRGTITASAHPLLLAHTFSGPGVQWSDDGGCGEHRMRCLLTLCGATSVLFPAAVVRNHSVNTSETADMLVCLAGDSDVVFEAADFQKNGVRPITVFSKGVKLHVKGSNFTNNTMHSSPAGMTLAGGALFITNGTALVESSNFRDNCVVSYGGVIVVQSPERIQMVSSVQDHNTGATCMPAHA